MVGDECQVCNIGYLLPSGRCDHCDAWPDVRKHCEFGGLAGPVADATSRRVTAEECMQAWYKFRDEADKYHKQTEGYAWIAVELARDAWLSLSERWYEQQKGR